MGNEHPIRDYEVGTKHVNLSVKLPSDRYLDELVKLRCGSDLLSYKLFPNAKEVTESFAAYSAVRKYNKIFDLGNENTTLVSVADGSLPRTAATFAFRTAWQCFSVDPKLRDLKEFESINRLAIYPYKIQQFSWKTLVKGKLVIVAVHPHVELDDYIPDIVFEKDTPALVVSMPCCMQQDSIRGVREDKEYTDWGIHSPKRQIKVWEFF